MALPRDYHPARPSGVPARVRRWTRSMRAIAAGVVGGVARRSAGDCGAGGAGNGASAPLPPPDPNAPSPSAWRSTLTRIGTDLSGKPILICHIELRDHFAQSVKALRRPGASRCTGAAPGAKPGRQGRGRGAGAGLGRGPDRPGTNAEYYDDLVTRTYALSLGSIPAWVVQWAGPTAPPARAPPRRRFRVRRRKGQGPDAPGRGQTVPLIRRASTATARAPAARRRSRPHLQHHQRR